MSVLFFDSFDHYTNNTPNFLEALNQEYTCNFLFHSPYLLTGRYSNHALYLGSLGVGNYVSKRIEQLNETTFFVMGFQFKKTGDQDYTGLSISFAPIPEIYVSYEYDIALYNKILFHDNEFKFITLTETSPVMATISDEEWHHIEMKMYYPGTGTWAFYVDGVQTGTWTPTTTIEWNKTVKFEISAINSPFAITEDVSKGWHIDDFYILDSFGSSYNNIIGPTARVETLLPTQDVVSELTITNTTSGYDSQNNIPFNKTQFIKSNIGSTDANSTYEYENLSRINDIGAIRQNTIAKVNDTVNYRSVDFAFLKNNQQIGPSIVKQHNTNFNNNSKSILLNTNPDTSDKWLKSELNLANFGIKSKQFQNMQIIACKDASTSDLYYPTLTNIKRFDANAYILMIRNGALTNPNNKIWETVHSGSVIGTGGDPSANFMLVKKKLNGLESDTMIAAQQSVTNHTFAIMFVTDWFDDDFDSIRSATDTVGNKTFPFFDYDFAQGSAVTAIRIIAPLSGTSVSSTSVFSSGNWTQLTSGISFSKFYYLNDAVLPRYAGDSGSQTYNDTMSGTTIASSIYMTIAFKK